MKKVYLLIIMLVPFILGFLFPSAISAQGLLTVGEVFDFSIGDKFQISGKAGGQPPNCDRITITDKFYSVNRDTLFYLRSHDSYYTNMLFEPPYIEYHFWTKSDTVLYTHLDSSISNFWVPYDSSMYLYDTINFIAENYCDSVVNGYHYEKNAFEPDIFIKQFGKGLGRVEDYYFSASSIPNNVVWDNVLIYYQKNGVSCGTPDTTALSVAENIVDNDLKISPNPAKKYFNIDLGKFKPSVMKIFNSKGELQDTKTLNTDNTSYDCTSFRSGIYFIWLTIGSENYLRKLVKE